MNTNKVAQTTCVFLLMFCISCSSTGSEFGVQSSESQNRALSTQNTEPKSEVDSILDKLNKRTRELQSYQCQIEYSYVQPSVFGAQTIRTGDLYFQKKDKISKFRVNFQTLQQDDDDEQKYNIQYIIIDGAELVSRASSLVPRETRDEQRFEGLWLVLLDIENKNCKYVPLTDANEPNKPVDVFELVSKYIPIVGFTEVERLKEEFDMSIGEKKKDALNRPGSGLTQVKFKVKPNSLYKDRYIQIDCWIDEKLNLPVEVNAVCTEPEGETLENKDVYEIKFINARVNEKIDKKVFDFKIPKDFGEPEIIDLSELK